MPAVGTDRVSIGPLKAGNLDFVGKAEHRGNAGERGRWGGRQLPVDFIDKMTGVLAVVLGLYGRVRSEIASPFNLALCIDRLAVGDVRR
jgi:hypothetical protein